MSSLAYILQRNGESPGEALAAFDADLATDITTTPALICAPSGCAWQTS